MIEVIKHLTKLILDDEDNAWMNGCGKGDNRPAKDKTAEIGVVFERAMSKGWFRRREGDLFVYDGSRYVRRASEDIDMIIKEVMEAVGVSPVYYFEIPPKIRTHIYRSHAIKPYKPLKQLISLKNGVYDIREQEFHCHSEIFETEIFFDFTYNKGRACEAWEAFITEVLPDITLRKVLQEFMAMLFIDRKEFNIEASFFLCGDGANGKGVVYETLTYMIGDNFSTYSLYDLCEHPQSMYNIAQANGKLVNFCSDMDRRDFTGGKYKSIASGESVMGRFPKGRPFRCDQMPVLASIVNNMPVMTDASYGNFRRMYPIPFNVTIPPERQNKNLKFEMRKEVDNGGIFNWIVEGYARLVASKGHITHSDAMAEAAEEIRVDNDSCLSFLKEYGYSAQKGLADTGEVIHVSSSLFYGEYQNYCKMYGYMPKSHKRFSAAMKKEGINPWHSRAGTTYSIFKGVQEDESIFETDNLPF